MVGRYLLGTHYYDGQIFIGRHIVMIGRSLYGDTLLCWADIYWGNIVMQGRSLLGNTFVMVGRYLLGDTLLWWADIYSGTHCYGRQIFIGATLL